MTLILSDREVVARKKHQCACCLSMIQPGEMYHKQVNIFDGDFGEFKTCDQCQSLFSAVRDYCDCDYVTIDCYETWAQETESPEAEAYLERRKP